LNTGGDLFYHLCSRVKKTGKGFSESEGRILLAEIFLAIDHLHQHNIIHRDIKIENVMIDANGHIKLADFGSSLEIEEEIGSYRVAGSLCYLAPELLCSEKLGGKFNDWWAYGVLAHELLTGDSPWSSLTDGDLIKNEILNKEVMISAQCLLSKQACEFITSLLCKDFRYRLGTNSSTDIKENDFFGELRISSSSSSFSSSSSSLNERRGAVQWVRPIDWKMMNKLKCLPAFIPATKIKSNSFSSFSLSSSSSSSSSLTNDDPFLMLQQQQDYTSNVNQEEADVALRAYYSIVDEEDLEEKKLKLLSSANGQSTATNSSTSVFWSLGLENIRNIM
jgi:serine/threonine protein kinase